MAKLSFNDLQDLTDQQIKQCFQANCIHNFLPEKVKTYLENDDIFLNKRQRFLNILKDIILCRFFNK